MKKLITCSFATLMLLQLSSCTKKDDSKPTPVTPTVSNKINPLQFETKWEATGIVTYNYNASGALTSASGISKTYVHTGVMWVDSFATFITFNGDFTCDVTHADGTPGGQVFHSVLPNHGTWSLSSDSTTLTLPFIPTPGPVKVVSFSSTAVDLVDSEVNSDHSSYATHITLAK